MKRSLSGLLRILLFPLAASGLALADARPFIITDIQLDDVNAGYVRLDIDALATARFGNPQTSTITITNVKVEESARDDGFIYTVAEGHGYAYARGEKINTALDLLLDTDEEFVRHDVRQVNNRSGSDYQMLLPTRTAAYGASVGEQLKFVTVRIVTRQRPPDRRSP